MTTFGEFLFLLAFSFLFGAHRKLTKTEMVRKRRMSHCTGNIFDMPESERLERVPCQW